MAMSTKGDEQCQPTKIYGLVIPADWDKNGNVIAVAISGFDEDVYLVDNDEKGERLLSVLRQEVEVVGIFREEGGKERIKVKEYSLRKISKDL